MAFNAPSDSIKPERLWVKAGRLYEGDNPVAARPFDSHDMMLFELHRGPSRAPNWATLPKLGPHSAVFDGLFKSEAAVADLKTKLDKAFVVFETDLKGIDDLTRPDKAAIRAIVAKDLQDRVKGLDGGGLFESRSVAGHDQRIELRGFSARLIPDLLDGAPLPSRDEGEPLFR